MARLNGVFRNYGHQFIYGFSTIELILKENHFREIKRESYLEGRNKQMLLDTEFRKIESFYVEAIK